METFLIWQNDRCIMYQYQDASILFVYSKNLQNRNDFFQNRLFRLWKGHKSVIWLIGFLWYV